MKKILISKESLSSAIGKLDATVTDFEIEEPEENEESTEAKSPDVRNFTYTFRPSVSCISDKTPRCI
ncbi:MAG: hypothetical protein ACLUEN_00135 [Coprococcus sp.]